MVALVVVVSRIEAGWSAVLLSKFTTAKSGFPSPLMSPMLMETGTGNRQ